MLKIVFKNLESSQLAKNAVEERIRPIIDKFPSLEGHSVTLTIEMENSPKQAGPDFFSVSSLVMGRIYKELKIKRTSLSSYIANAAQTDALNKLLSRESDRLKKNHRKNKVLIGENLYE